MARFSPLSPDDPQTVASYVLRAQLGAGGMGKVFLSFTPGGRPIAIKVVRPEFAEDDEFRRRFRQEIAAAQRVQGLYTAPVIDADPDARVPWLATAYVPGPSLHEAVSEHGPLPPPSVFRLLGGTAEALISIHAAGLVHRDLKPANVLLAEDGPRVIDFGIARALDATTLTRTGTKIGTPAFMAPEQIRGEPTTSATDVFAVGQLAAWAAGGRPAFGEGATDVLLFRILNQPPDLDGCPVDVRELALRCLAKDPAERPSTAEIIETCRARTAGQTMSMAESWLPSDLAEVLAGYRTWTAPPPADWHPPTELAESPDPPAALTPPAAPGPPGGPTAPPVPPATPTEPPRPQGVPMTAVVALVAVVAVVVLASTTVGAIMLSSNRSGGNSAGTVSRTSSDRTSHDQGGDSGPSSPKNASSPPDEAAPTGPSTPTDPGTPTGRSTPSRASSGGTTTYTESGFQIAIPDGWSRRSSSGDSSGSVFWDAPDGVTYLQVDPQSWSAPFTSRAQAEQADARARKSAARFKGYSLIGISDTGYQDGAATDWEFTFDSPEGAGRIHSKDRFFRANGRTFALYLRGPASSWSTLQGNLNGFYRTFRAS